ncbi:hypothetical protein JW933_10420, partial [candidate division FCPU426 bacterium]|nr:hypothetical protein [candidate division FCPU426 bacterium]
MGKHAKTAGAAVIILSLSLTGFADDRAWEFFGPPDQVFGYQAVIEIYNGTPFIGYTAAGYRYRVIVKKYNGAAW